MAGPMKIFIDALVAVTPILIAYIFLIPILNNTLILWMCKKKKEEELEEGDHLYSYKLVFSHHAIYEGLVGGKGKIIEFSKPGLFKRLKIMRNDASKLKKRGIYKVINYKNSTETHSKSKIVATARSHLNNEKKAPRYNLFFCNCECLARGCVTGDYSSPQVIYFLRAITWVLTIPSGIWTKTLIGSSNGFFIGPAACLFCYFIAERALRYMQNTRLHIRNNESF
ncbi:hypothetical protein [Azospirillum argentinense]|uniref:lecithin retinol acyltransferase family protein n=1 Tax=Azospirillum argentinense TaxID=2970906 RepID=UPI0032DF6FB4